MDIKTPTDLIDDYFLAKPGTPQEIEAIYNARLPWISLALRRIVTEIHLEDDDHDNTRTELMLSDLEAAMLTVTHS